MKIGIDGSRAFLKQRTGVEEYSYQVIKKLRDRLKEHRVILYLRSYQEVDFSLPANWRIRRIHCPRLWTQVGLSLEMFLRPVDVLFVPAHTAPFFHPKKTVVTVHGLEYEIMPEAYSPFERVYMRFSIKNSCRWARKIICVSKNTKRDIMNLYEVPEEKINIVYEGYEDRTKDFDLAGGVEIDKLKPYLLFVGRLEKRKNILGIIEAFDLFKKKTGFMHKLVLGGKFGYGEEEIKARIEQSEYKKDIILFGFVKDARKWQLYKNAQIFLFPTLYEGFGLPILEAQSQGVPVITSNTSSLPEVAGNSAFLVDPTEPKFIADAMIALTQDEKMAKEMIKKGYENIRRFSWKNCADLIATVLTE
ncbi:MAG: glycosyltransferase family 1 protein [Candidatus Moranbacteria bacterium]|nr:glycosyltransferase family 1 protein [Candidatus Moranbacteria bacterium]